ncbi:MAG TPA: transglycosylase family protein [Mycobacteriales bacterium]|jgi:LysM repeat protein|nr:transglycosylase family protein [Mycobacteriales bacterium]
MRKAAVAVAAVGAAAAAPLIGGGVAHADGSVWDNVAQCESTGNWSINTGNGFSGGLQFTQSTWAAYGGTAYAPQAYQASREQQIAVAQRVLAGQGPGAWPVCSIKGGLTSSNGGSTSAPVSNDQQTQSQPTQQQAQPQQAAPQAAAPQRETAPSAASTGSAISGPSYVVKSGDTLSKIALRSHVNWHSLYSHNKKVVGSNPNVIYPGQQLQLG